MFDASAFGCNHTELQEEHFFKTPHNTRISVLQHINGKKFIIKQEQRKSLRGHLIVAKEKLGVEVARSINVNTNNVLSIPKNQSFPGKAKCAGPATLHTFVPGFKVSTLPKELKSFKIWIQQPVKPSVPKDQWGLTRKVITNMAQHPDLPRIVALDTFIANADRHRGNFFYDPKSDHYFVIDLESSFGKNLASYACKLMKTFINNNTSLSRAELEALHLYGATLKKLIKLHTPEQLYEKLVNYSIENGILARVSRPVAHTIIKKMYKKTMTANYASCIRLIDLIDNLLKKHDFRIKK